MSLFRRLFRTIRRYCRINFGKTPDFTSGSWYVSAFNYPEFYGVTDSVTDSEYIVPKVIDLWQN